MVFDTPFHGRFLVSLIWRLALLILAVFAFVQSFYMPGLGATRIVAGLLVIGAASFLWRHIQRTNIELSRFIEAVRFGDYNQAFSYRLKGSGFGELGGVLDDGIRRLRDERHKLIDANRFYEAVLDDAPTALLIADGEGRVELANKAARRLLNRHKGVRIEDFSDYGDAFVRFLSGSAAGQPRLVPLMIESVPQTALVSAAVVHRLGGQVRAVAVQPVQSELNTIEIAAQSDLIRVLTHEIMNSITPVTSLAHSAVDLMKKVDPGDPSIADALQALETLARRADGVMHFVESYRQISRAPEIRRRSFAVRPWCLEIETLFRADAGENIAFSIRLEPEALKLDADPDLLSQVLINLLKNAADAARDHSTTPEVSLSILRTGSGRVRIEVADNGPGIPESIRQDIFLPFFTTKIKGTGVGLSLARQVILAHQGSIDVVQSESGGALFRLVI